MTTFAKIGPIELTQAHEIVDPETDPGKFQISIKCTPEQAKQLAGLCQPVTRTETNSPRHIRSRENRWGIMPIESPVSSVISNYSDYTGLLKCLGILSNPREYFINTRKSKVIMDGEMVSQNLNEILTILYSQGGEDGSDIEHNYSDSTISYLLNELFSGAYTDNWTAYDNHYMTAVTVNTSSGKLVMTGTNTGGGAIGDWGGLSISSLNTYEPPWTLEFDLEWVSGTDHNMSVFITETVPHPWIDVNIHHYNTNYIRFYLYYHNSKLYYAVTKSVGGSVSYLVPETELSTSTEKSPRFKVTYDADGNMEIYIDTSWADGDTPTYTLIWGKAYSGHKWSNPGFLYQFNNMNYATHTMKSSGFQVSVEGVANYPNVVVAPPGAVCNETADFTRPSEDGNIQCFEDPITSLNYQITPANFYKGSVKAWNSNYTDGVARLVTHNEVDLDPTKFYVTNGMVKLVTTSNGVEFHYWNGTAYVKLNTFTLPSTISLIRPFFVSKDRFILQLDRTFWTVAAGKPGIWIEHPTTAIGYTPGTCYYHDATTTTDPAAGADISMLTQFYCNIWNRGTGTCAAPNPADRYRLTILRDYDITIKANSLPPANKSGIKSYTGILFYDSNISDSAQDGSLYRAREWYKPIKQSLVLQGV